MDSGPHYGAQIAGLHQSVVNHQGVGKTNSRGCLTCPDHSTKAVNALSISHCHGPGGFAWWIMHNGKWGGSGGSQTTMTSKEDGEAKGGQIDTTTIFIVEAVFQVRHLTGEFMLHWCEGSGLCRLWQARPCPSCLFIGDHLEHHCCGSTSTGHG